MEDEVASRWLEWTNLILGAALACAVFAFLASPAAAWNAGVVGALIVCCSALALYRYEAWMEWSNLTLGCWAMFAPYLLRFGSVPTAMWTHVPIGFCVTTIAIVQLLGSGRPRAHEVKAGRSQT